MAKESRRMPASGIRLPLKTHFLPSTSLANLIASFRYEGAFEKCKRHGHGIETFSDGSRYFSPFMTHFLLSTSLATLISSIRYEGAFEKNERHGQGIETNANGYRFFSPFKDSIPSINLSCEFNFFF